MSLTSCEVHCSGRGSNRQSTVLTYCGTPPLPPCSVRVHLWLASVRSCDTVPHDDGPLRQGGLRPLIGNRPTMAGGSLMLITHVDRYILLRQTLGFKLHDKARIL